MWNPISHGKMKIDEHDIALILFCVVVVGVAIMAGVFRDELLKVWEWIT